jgi:hypothetical protein
MRPGEHGEWILVSAHPPGRTAEPVGILLIDVVRDELHVKVRNNWSGISNEDETEMWGELAQDLAENASDMGAAQFLSWLESTASHFIRIGTPTHIEVVDFEDALTSLYREHVLPERRGDCSMAGHS